jgi:hypothetical protein
MTLAIGATVRLVVPPRRGVQLGVAFGPNLVGLLRDAAGGYGPVLWAPSS